MAHYLEEKKARNKEKEESGSPSQSDVLIPSPPPAHIKDKKSADKGNIGLLNINIINSFTSISKYTSKHKPVCFSLELPNGENRFH